MSWYDDMPFDQLQKLGKKIDEQGLDHVFQVTHKGVVDGPAGIYRPKSVEHDAEHDILIDGIPLKDSKPWTALTGFTGQHLYHGAVMHPSEFIGGGLAEYIVRASAEHEEEGNPLVWVAMSVEVSEEPDNPAGWTVLYRELAG